MENERKLRVGRNGEHTTERNKKERKMRRNMCRIYSTKMERKNKGKKYGK